MQKIIFIPTGEAGNRVAARLQGALGPDFVCETIQRSEVADRWTEADALVFIGAMGICVRTIAPMVGDKHTDPAVVCIDTQGQYAIPVLSGHIGGANELARRLGDILSATPVITTQSDSLGLWALDTLSQRFDWPIARGEDDMNPIIFAFVNGQPTALLIEAEDEGTDYLRRTLPPHVTLIHDISEATPERYRLLILVSPYIRHAPWGLLTLHFVPMVGVIGFGLAHHPDDYEYIYDEIDEAMAERGILPCANRYATIDVKRDEEFVELLREEGHEVQFFTAEELAHVAVPTPSATVRRHVGTPSVAEAAALLASGGGRLIVPKVKGRNWTAALAFRPTPQPLPAREGSGHLTAVPEEGHKDGGESKGIYSPPYKGGARGGSAHIEIIGAGPGDPDLISVRGRRLLEQADLILYAGSLVPKALTECHKPGAEVVSSASMTLEEQCALMHEHYKKGHFIVRLHTGDPCIFGAIQEQMAYFDAHQMSYHITPGISSFLAAAAELRSQFTIPGRTQTIILTRGEGRTPMPEAEQLRRLAQSRSTMCIFLSAAIVEDVQRQLLEHYPPTTPVAACYHLTWPDQRIYRGQLSELASLVKSHGLTLTTMLVVGDAIDNRRGLSELYNANFTHLFREGRDVGGESL